VELGDQFVVTERLPDIAPVQLPDVCARAGGTRTALPASASKTAIRICKTEANEGLEFIRGANGVEGAGGRLLEDYIRIVLIYCMSKNFF
jgi:hypothetical protein